LNQRVNFGKLIARVQRIRWLQPPVIALLLGNLIPLVALYFFHWDVFSLLFLFWLENVIIGIVNVLKIIFAGTGASNGLSSQARLIFFAAKLFLIPFFCIHYGLFTLVHGVFIIGLFDKGVHHGFGISFPLILQVIRDNHLQWPFAGLVVSHLISFFWDFLWRGEFRQANPLELMKQPYSRVVVMQLTIIIGGFLMMALHSPEAGLVFLVILKTGIDLHGYQAERERISKVPERIDINRVTTLIQSRIAAASPPGTRGAQQNIPARLIAVVFLVFIFFAAFTANFAYRFVKPLIAHPRTVQAKAVPAATNSTLALYGGPPSIPETHAAGKFRGSDFSVSHAILTDKTLTLQDSADGVTREFVITLDLDAAILPGNSYDIAPKAGSGLEIKMVERRKKSQNTWSQPFSGNYVLKLNFGSRNKNKIPAKIYLALPDAEQSHVAGTFDVLARKSKNPPPAVAASAVQSN
jgi:hypothetical protein